MIKSASLAVVGAMIGYWLGHPGVGAFVGVVVGAFLDMFFCTPYLMMNGTEGWDGDFD